MKLQPRFRTRMYRSLPRRGTQQHSSKSMFYSAVSYARYIPGICLSYLFSSTLAGLPGLPSAPGCFRPGLSADPFCFCNRQPANSRLGPAKVPQPCVDLINMAAPAWCLALTVGTPKFKGLLLSCSVLVLNGRGGVAIKEARKEWHPPDEVRCPANVQSRDRRGFIHLPNSVWLHRHKYTGIYLWYTRYISGIFLRYVWYKSGIFLRYTRYISGIFLRYVWYISRIYYAYTSNILNIFHVYFRNIPYICLSYVWYMTWLHQIRRNGRTLTFLPRKRCWAMLNGNTGHA